MNKLNKKLEMFTIYNTSCVKRTVYGKFCYCLLDEHGQRLAELPTTFRGYNFEEMQAWTQMLCKVNSARIKDFDVRFLRCCCIKPTDFD